MTTNRPTAGAKAVYTCLCCRLPFEARIADRKRGWGRYCSKRCKAIKQEVRTGQHQAYLVARDGHDKNGLCFPSHAEGDVQ